MKGPTGSHFVLIISLLILLSGPSLLPMTGGSPPFEKVIPLGGSYTPFEGSIIIDSEDDFNETNGVVSGSGTQADPYIIEGWSFNTSATAIKVIQTISHLIISNVSIAMSIQFGIQIEGADNVQIQSCYLGANAGGIWLIGPCKDIAIEGNTIENNIGTGIRIEGWFENLTIIRNYLFMNQIDGLYADNPNGKNIAISNNSFLMNFGFGIEIIGGTCFNLSMNRILRNGNGGILAEGSSGSGVEIRSNLIEDHIYYGMELQGIAYIIIDSNSLVGGQYSNIGIYLGSNSHHATVTRNTLFNHGIGIYLGSSSHHTTITRNTLFNHGNSISVGIDCNNNSVIENRINHTSYGIYVYSSFNLFLSNSISNFSDYAIFIFGNENVVQNNLVCDEDDSYQGIEVWGGLRNSILNNAMIRIRYPIRIRSSQDAMMSDNLFGPGSLSIALENSSHCIVKRNRLLEDQSRIILDRCDNITIYDNQLSNDSSGSERYSNDILWCLPNEVSGENIIGGGWIKGNYWPDYQGEDIDGDGIGDTLLPFGPGDWGPLVMDPPPPDKIAPNITLVNGEIPPEMGSEHNFVFNVSDDRTLFEINVTMDWIQSDPGGFIGDSHGSKALTLNGSGTFAVSALMEASAEWINFTSLAIDHAGNSRDQVFCVRVSDGTDPELLQISYDDEAFTGEDLGIVIHARDNIGIQRVYASYAFDFAPDIIREAIASKSMQWKDGYDISIPVHRNASNVEFRLVIVDRSNNSVISPPIEIIVTDTIAPRAKDITPGYPCTGETFPLKFLLEDNIGVSEAELTVRFDGFSNRSYKIVGEKLGQWNVSVLIGLRAHKLDFELKIKDIAGHVSLLPGKYNVTDTIPPTIVMLSNRTPETGKTIEIRFKIDENRELSHAEAEWTFDRGGGSDNLIEFSDLAIEIPEEAHRLNLTVSAYDTSWNVGKFMANFSVIDATPPKVDLMAYPAYTSLETRIEVRSSDNWGVERTWVQYSFDGGAIQSGSGSCDVLVPESAMNMVVTGFSEDISDQVGYTTRELIVNDGTPPRIIDHSIDEIGGGKVRFTVTASDNRDLGDAYLLLDAKEPLLMTRTTNGTYRIDVEKGNLKGIATYRFNVTDRVGLSMISSERSLELEDGDERWLMAWIAVPIVAIVCLVIVLLAIRGRRVAYVEE